MFTGIISHLGISKKILEKGLLIEAPRDLVEKLSKGSSIAINGVCLTVVKILNKRSFAVDVMPETRKKTSLNTLAEGEFVNLELPMGINSRFDGHVVYGHVDGVGEITKVEQDKSSYILEVKVPKSLTNYMVEKGAVALNGISLTLIDVGSDFFTTGIIPYTFKNTVLKNAETGDLVNIEVDIFAKYIRRIYEKH